MDIPLLDALRTELVAERRSARTIATYVAVAGRFLLVRPGEYPSRGDVVAFLGRPRSDGGPRSVAARNQELAALRALSAVALPAGVWNVDPTTGLSFLREPARTPTVLSSEEIRLLFRTAVEIARSPKERARNLAVLAVLSQIGLRVHEVVALDVGQVDLASATLVAVRGKGGTRHDLPLNAPAVALLSGWLAVRGDASSPALFLSRLGGRLGIRSIERLLVRLRRGLGTARPITPHVLRHAFATIALTEGAELLAVSQCLRHASVATTQRYIHLVDRHRRDAVRRVAVSVPSEVLRSTAATDVQLCDGHAFSAASPESAEISLDDHDALDDVQGAERAA